ncbi:MAG: type II toxin-antitoxin system RelE/ParE family toxin [Coriobacteriia bacterium]|nr:type II toxin-antitoxin system RelE/ParE family toxin [Coriobacteriia bacterium]MCL2745698.1 type II toxin-antitoxin system RelE/ParE family toxin [Coriobacteriia bacterium]MCL2870452.1 type II toxin-antitoxin system RelE/ParE family toxin [Coriobacteriia bacterium]
MNRNYTWSFDRKAEKQFAKLDAPVQKRILKWLEEHIEECENPRHFGKALEGDYKSLWRYRIGKYRLIADIQDGEFRVFVLKVAARGNVDKD